MKVNEQLTFTNFLANIASYGGDTDTNCCIGAALFGAFHGIEKIPEIYIKQVTTVRCARYKQYQLADISNFFSSLRF